MHDEADRAGRRVFETHRVLVENLYRARVLHAHAHERGHAVGLELEGAIPGVEDVFGGELVAPVAHDAAAEMEGDAAAVGIEIPGFSERTDWFGEIGVEQTVRALLLVERHQGFDRLPDPFVAGPAAVVFHVQAGRRFRSGDQQSCGIAGRCGDRLVGQRRGKGGDGGRTNAEGCETPHEGATIQPPARDRIAPFGNELLLRRHFHSSPGERATIGPRCGLGKCGDVHAM